MLSRVPGIFLLVAAVAPAACDETVRPRREAGAAGDLGSLLDGAGSGEDAARDGSFGREGSPDLCTPIPGATYSTSSVSPEKMTPEQDPGFNLLLLKSRPAAGQAKALVHYDGPADAKAPRLNTLFAGDRKATFVEVYQLTLWDEGCKCPGSYVTDPPVSMAGLQSTPGEVVELPRSGYDIGGGYQALVLYAAANTIAVKYSRDDNLSNGYAIYLAGICVEPTLLALYQKAHAAGRHELPQLRGDQPLGRAAGPEVRIAIRDTGTLLDPRGDALHTP